MNYEETIVYKAIDRNEALAYHAGVDIDQAIEFAAWRDRLEAAEAKELEMITEGIFLALVESGVDKLLCSAITDEDLHEMAVRLAKLVAVRLYVDRSSAA